MSARAIEACEALLRLEAEHDGFIGSLPSDFGPAIAREYLKLASVVAAQREALQEIAACANKPYCGDCYQIAQEALDAEGVSEPGERAGSHPHGAGRTEHHSPISLTSPVDTPPGAKP